MKPSRLFVAVVALIGITSGAASAASLQEAVSQAVLTHPEVQASWHELQASGHETDVAKGAWLPKVDLLISANRERRDRAPANGERDYASTVSKLSLQQNLFDGFATRSTVQRLDHAGRARYYQLLDTSESVAFTATQAYINLYRQQQQLEYAKENYVIHRGLFERLKMRASAGLAPLVDLEMAGARLALAESDLSERAGQYHDAKARYQHAVGIAPKAGVAPPPALLAQAMPESRAAAVALGIGTSPRLKAAIEQILAAQRYVAVQRAPNYPRIDFLADTSQERNPQGVTGTQSRTTLGVQLNFNLYRGHKDSYRIREAAEAKYKAADDRDTTCRHLRETLAKTYNDNTRFTDQLPLLDQHQLSADKSREAMLQQFSVGRRTLLDLLDTEAEYYKARSDYLAGEMDLAIAQARYLANAGILLGTLKLAHREAEIPPTHTELEKDLVTQCPPDIVPEPPTPAPQPKKTESYAVLLANADGSVGQIAVKGKGGEQTIDKPLFGVPMDGSAAPARVDDEKIKRDFGDAMSAQPPLPESYLLYFRSNSARLTDKSRETLPRIVASINSRPAVEITLTGYADTVGSVKVNQALSMRRAKAIADYLKSRKVDTSKLEIEAHGKTMQLVPTPDQTAEQGNRAVKIRLR